MTFHNLNLQFTTPEAFSAWLAGQPRPTWARGSTYHNTYRPTEAQWAGRASMKSMQKTYEGNGWDRGPHLFLAVGTKADGIFVMTEPWLVGIHGVDCNKDRFGIEVVGDFQSKPMSEGQLNLLVEATAALHRWAGIGPDINAHRDCVVRTCPGDAAYAQKPEIQRRLAAKLGAPSCLSHGFVLTDSLDLRAAFLAGGFRSLKVVTGWGQTWTEQARLRAAALSEVLIVRTVAGDPASNKDFPHWEEVIAELRPWWQIRPHLFVEIGNEPNVKDLDPAGYAWHLSKAVAVVRTELKGARVISPALSPAHPMERWSKNPEFQDAIGLCHAYGVHQYAHQDLVADDTGHAKLNRANVPTNRPWMLTEYGIHDPAMTDQEKGRRYAQFRSTLGPSFLGAFTYHLCDRPIDKDQTAYALEPAAYGGGL